MSEGLETLAVAIDRVRQLLLGYGDELTVCRLSTLADRLRSGDTSAVVSAVSEATGGMGSLNDRYLCRENGDKIAAHEVVAANKRLANFVKDVEAAARAAAASNYIRLMR
jgi:hypothetical protein